MTSPAKPSLVLSILAALTPFLWAPLMVAASLMLSGGHGEDVARWFQEGGWVMYGILWAGALVSLVGTGLLFFGAYKTGPAATAILPLVLLLPLLGVVGQHLDMEGAARAVAMANPADRAIIMCAATAEASRAPTFGMLGAGALLVAVALGLSLGALARRTDGSPTHRRLLGFAGLGALATGLWCFVAATSLHSFANAYAAAAHAAPADRMIIMVASLEDAATLRPVGLGLAVLAVALFGVGAAMVRAVPASAVLLGALGVLTLGGAAGVVAFTGAGRAKADTMLASAATELLAFPAGDVADQLPTLVVTRGAVSGLSMEMTDADLGNSLRERLEQRRTLHEEAGSPDGEVEGLVAWLSLEQNVDAATLNRVLALLASHGVKEVRLMGSRPRPPPPGLTIPPELQGLFKSFGSVQVEVPVGLAQKRQECPSGCPLATLTERGVKLQSEEWPHRELPLETYRDPVELKRLPTAPDLAMSPLALARGAVTAQSHQALLVLVY